MTQILSVCYVSDDLLVSGEAAVTMMDTVPTLMEHSFQGGKQINY